MTTRTIHPGEIGADYPTRLASSILANNHVTWVVRYITNSTTSWKALKPAEATELLASGVGILLVWETSEQAILGGAQQGTTDGKLAAVRAQALGYPAGLAILAAVDTDTVKSNSVQCNAYLRAFYASSGPYKPGGYFDEDAFALVADCHPVWCIPNAFGWSPQYWAWIKSGGKQGRPFTGHILQGHDKPEHNWDFPNVVVNPFDVWSTTGTPSPKPSVPATQTGPSVQTTPIPMPDLGGEMRNAIIHVQSDPAVFLGVVNEKGAALNVEWSGPGDDPRTGARLEAHLAAGAVDLGPIDKLGLKNCTLNGPVPPGWVESDFYRVNG